MSDTNPIWVILELGYQRYVLSLSAALTVVELMAGAYRWEDRYHDATKTYTRHAYPMDEVGFNLRILTDEAFRCAKLAGKPE